MARILSISLVAILLVGTSAAWADDINPAPWRGEWSTTFQYWQFETPDTGASSGGLTPDGPGPLIEGQNGDPYTDSGYLPSTRLWVYPFSDWIDIDLDSGRYGIWPLSGYIDVVVDNHDPVNPEKLLWVQLTWRPTPGTTGVPIIQPDTQVGFTSTPVRIEDEQSAADGWTTTTYAWEIHPNPMDEWFTISGDIDVDQLVIDTWCIPEPATLSLLVLGGLMMLRRRRK